MIVRALDPRFIYARMAARRTQVKASPAPTAPTPAPAPMSAAERLAAKRAARPMSSKVHVALGHT